MSEANIWQPRTIIQTSADTKIVSQRFTATEGQTLFTITDFAYTLGTGALTVYRQNSDLTKLGLRKLAPVKEFVEQTTASFSIVAPAVAGEQILVEAHVGVTANVDVRDTDIFVANYQAIRDYVGTEITLFAQGEVTHADGGEGFFEKVTGAAPGFYVDNNYNIIVPTGGDGSIAWLNSAKPFTSVANAVKFSLVANAPARTISYYDGWAATLNGPSGGSDYVSVTKAAHDIIRGVGTVDELGDHTLPNTNVLLLDIGEVVGVDQFGADLTGTAEAVASCQAAIDSQATEVRMMRSLKISTSLTPREGRAVIGTGIDKTVIDGTGLGISPVFLWETANGSVDRKGPIIQHMTLNARSGVRLNNSANGFTDDASTQENIISPSLQYLKISGIDHTGVGIEVSKCFEMEIKHNNISACQYNVRTLGCDTGEVMFNRLTGAGTACYREDGRNTFGNNVKVMFNFMSNVASGGIAHIMTSNRVINIQNNQIEQTTTPAPKLAAPIQVFNNTTDFPVDGVDIIQSVIIDNNPLLVTSTTCDNLLDFDTVEWQYLRCIGNDSVKGANNPARFNGTVKYWYNSLARRIINVAGSENVDPPFISNEHPVSGIEGIHFSPNNPGLSPSLQGIDTVIEDGAFKLPPVAAAGHTIILDPTRAKVEVHDGVISMDIVAKADIDGQVLNWQFTWNSGAASVDVGSFALSTSWTKYRIYPNFDYDQNFPAKAIRLWNQDTVTGGDILVKDAALAYDLMSINTSTTELEDITSYLNTVNKYPGRTVYNSTTNKPVWADGTLAASVWVDATGAIVHTPV